MARSVRVFKETLEMRSLLLHRIRSHRYFPVAVIATIVLAVACTHIWQRVVVIGLVQQVSRLQKENRQLIDDTHKVQSEIAALSMASRIERYAADSLGLARVGTDCLYTLVSEESSQAPADQLATVLSSIKRVADYLPEVSDANAARNQLEPIRFETDGDGEQGE